MILIKECGLRVLKYQRCSYNKLGYSSILDAAAVQYRFYYLKLMLSIMLFNILLLSILS